MISAGPLRPIDTCGEPPDSPAIAANHITETGASHGQGSRDHVDVAGRLRRRSRGRGSRRSSVGMGRAGSTCRPRSRISCFTFPCRAQRISALCKRRSARCSPGGVAVMPPTPGVGSIPLECPPSSSPIMFPTGGHPTRACISSLTAWRLLSHLDQSVVDDVARIGAHPLVPGRIPIYGYVYDVATGRLNEILEATKAGEPRPV
jgi:hypothetical protein